jgi:hypothetical protein
MNILKFKYHIYHAIITKNELEFISPRYNELRVSLQSLMPLIAFIYFIRPQKE